MAQTANFNKFFSTYSCKRLLEHHALDEYGKWEVFGEDPNCDFGGPHVQPYLGLLEGSLPDVIAEAVEMPGFWRWGFGGEIKKAVTGIARVVRKPLILDDNLFALIEQKTHENKIKWAHCHDLECGKQLPDGYSDCPDSQRLTGRVPGTTMTLLLVCDRQGTETLTLSIGGETVTVGVGDHIAALRRYVLARPVEDAIAEASKILESL